MECRGSWRQLPEMLAKLSQYIYQVAVETIEHPGAFYYNTPQEVEIHDLIWEVFYQIEADIAEDIDKNTGFGVKSIDRVKVATIIHEGSYRKAGSSYKQLEDWISKQGLKICGVAEEEYLTNFNQITENQRIEIRLPVSTA